MEFGVPGVFHIDIELLQLSNPTFLGEAIKSGHVSPFSVTLVHQHVPVTQQQYSLSCRMTLSPFYYFVLPASECLGPGLNLTSLHQPMVSDQSCQCQIGNSSSCRNAAHSGVSSPFPLDVPAAVTRLRKWQVLEKVIWN